MNKEKRDLNGYEVGAYILRNALNCAEAAAQILESNCCQDLFYIGSLFQKPELTAVAEKIQKMSENILNALPPVTIYLERMEWNGRRVKEGKIPED